MHSRNISKTAGLFGNPLHAFQKLMLEVKLNELQNMRRVQTGPGRKSVLSPRFLNDRSRYVPRNGEREKARRLGMKVVRHG